MTGNFYDKIVRRFGRDVPEAKHITDYPEGDPEGVFEQKLFLQGVPIFEDFDSQRDRNLLEAYVATSQTHKGIRLPRHRIVIVAVKF